MRQTRQSAKGLQRKRTYEGQKWGKIGLKSRGVYSGHFPPPRGGGKNRHLWKSGEENRPQWEKKFNCKEKNWILQANVFFSITIATLLRNT